MSQVRIAAWTTLRALLRPGNFFALLLTSLALLLFLRLPLAGSASGLFASRIELLQACLLFPGILVAMQLRRAWPALGPEDEAQVWLTLLGRRCWPSRLGAFLGAAAALLCLLAFEALLFGVALGVLPDAPRFRSATSLDNLDASGKTSFLVGAGDIETFALPQIWTKERQAPGLYLKPLWSLGPRNPIEVEVLARVRTGPWRSLGRTSFREPGSVQALALEKGLGGATRLGIRRLTPRGTLISLTLGDVLLIGPRLGRIETGLRTAWPYLSWALLLLLAGLSLAALLPPGLWGLAVLCSIPLIGLAPGLTTGVSHLAQGLSSIPPRPGNAALLLALVLLTLGLFLPRRIRPPELLP